MDKYKKVQELISLWDEFESKTGCEDFSDFGRWLHGHNQNIAERDDSKIAEISNEASSHLDFYKKMHDGRQFLTLLSRSSRFIDFYIKKALEGLAIGSRLEFQFLVSIFEMQNPRKTDVIYFNLVELSTGVETLKRMQRNGLVSDMPDPGDKRTKRLKLTEKGKNTLSQAMEKFGMLDQLAHSFGKDGSWKGFIPSLIWFNDFHNEIYHKHKDKPFDELMRLMFP